MKSGAVSSGSARPRSAAETSDTPNGSTSAAISLSLPALWLARTSLDAGASRRAMELAEGCRLGGEQLLGAGFGQAKQ